MALVEIDVVVQRITGTGLIYVVDGASVYVERADGSAIAVWQNSAGTSPAALPLTSRNGRVDGWVEGGLLLRYRAVHPSLDPTAPWEFFTSGGGPVGPLGPAGPAGPSAADGSISVIKTGVNDAGLARGAFHIGSAVATSVVAGTEVVIPLATVQFDVSGGANGTGYTVPVTGVYRLAGNWRCASGLTTGSRVIVYLQVNGATRLQMVQNVAGPDQAFFAAGLVKCAAGDTVRLVIRQDTGGSRSTQPGTDSTFLCGELVGRAT